MHTSDALKFLGMGVLLLGLSACGAGEALSGTPAPDSVSRGTPDLAPAPLFRAPSLPITRDNAPQVAYIGRLDVESAPSSIFSHAFALDGSRLVALNNQALVGWELTSGARAFNVTRGNAIAVFYASTLNEFYTLEEDGTIIVRQTDSAVEQNRFGAAGFGGVFSYQPEYDWLAMADEIGGVQVWELTSRTSLATLSEAASAPISALAFSADGTRLATAGTDGVVRVWSWQERQLLARFEQADGGIGALAFAPDGASLTTGTPSYIATWDITSGELRYSFNVGFGSIPDVLRYAPDGRSIVTGGFESDMLLIDPLNGGIIAQLPDVSGERVSAVFAPDSSLMLTSVLDGDVTLWDMLGMTAATIPSAVLPVESRRIVDVAWSPDSFLLAFFDAAGSVYLWGIPRPPSA